MRQRYPYNEIAWVEMAASEVAETGCYCSQNTRKSILHHDGDCAVESLRRTSARTRVGRDGLIVLPVSACTTRNNATFSASSPAGRNGNFNKTCFVQMRQSQFGLQIRALTVAVEAGRRHKQVDGRRKLYAEKLRHQPSPSNFIPSFSFLFSLYLAHAARGLR